MESSCIKDEGRPTTVKAKQRPWGQRATDRSERERKLIHPPEWVTSELSFGKIDFKMRGQADVDLILRFEHYSLSQVQL